MRVSPEKESRWEGRLWTLFQLGLVALVGFLSLQATDAQKVLSGMLNEQKHTNQRLDRIEASIDRVNEDRYRMQALTNEHDRIERRVEALEEKVYRRHPAP